MIDQEGEEQMQACADKAEDVATFSIEEAQTRMMEKLALGAATGETLTWYCKECGIVPHDDRAFGAVLRSLSVSGKIRKIGYSTRHRGHGTAGAIVWALA